MCYEKRDTEQARACFERDQRGEKMAEYIEREAAYEKCGWYNTVNGKSVCAVRKDELAAIPAADIAPVVHGRWFKTDRGMREVVPTGEVIRVYFHDCSVCGWHTGNQGRDFNYCPNCGARMDGE